jgi:hypothetical protein
MFRLRRDGVLFDVRSTADFCGDTGTSLKFMFNTNPTTQMAGLPAFYVNEVSSNSDLSSLLVRLNRTLFTIAQYPHNGLGQSQCPRTATKRRRCRLFESDKSFRSKVVEGREGRVCTVIEVGPFSPLSSF